MNLDKNAIKLIMIALERMKYHSQRNKEKKIGKPASKGCHDYLIQPMASILS